MAMDAPAKGRRGRKKSVDSIRRGRTDPLSLVDAIREYPSQPRHRMFYISTKTEISSLDGCLSDDTEFLIICGDLKDESSCKKFLTEVSSKVDPKRVIYVPTEKVQDLDSVRGAVEGLHMAFLEDQLMIFKDGCRFIYESSDLMAASYVDIKEEMAGSDFAILGSSIISSGGLYDDLNQKVPAANMVVVTGKFDSRFNINWTYLSNSISSLPAGIRVFNDIDSSPRFFDINLKQNLSTSFKNGMNIMTSEQYREFLKSLDMPSTYKTDKDVTIVTEEGYSMMFLTIRIFTSTILDGGTLLKIEHPRDYFRENIPAYVKNAKALFMDYYLRLKDVSAAVRRIGGVGTIEGSTIVVDEDLKLVVDPVDMGVVLYRATTGELEYYNSFKDSGYLDDEVIESDEHLRSTLSVKKVRNNVPENLARRKIRDMNHISDALQSIISHDLVRRWDDRVLDSSFSLPVIMQKPINEEEEE